MGDSERGGWKKERTFSTIDRARFGCPSSPPRPGETSDGRTVPEGDIPGTGIGKGELSIGLGRMEDTEEQCEAPGGESSDNASGLRTFAWPACSAFICAIAVEMAGAIDAGCFLCLRTASDFARTVSPGPEGPGAVV